MAVIYKSNTQDIQHGDIDSDGYQIGLTAMYTGSASTLNQVTDFAQICSKYDINTGATQCTFTLAAVGGLVKLGYEVTIMNRGQVFLLINDSSATRILNLGPGETCRLCACANHWDMFMHVDQRHHQLLVRRMQSSTLITSTTVQSVSLPANLMGANDSLLCRAFIYVPTGNTSTKYSVRINGTTICAMSGSNSNNPCSLIATITNVDSTTTQEGVIYHSNSGGGGMGYGNTSLAGNTAATFTFALCRDKICGLKLLSFELYIIREKVNIYDLI